MNATFAHASGAGKAARATKPITGPSARPAQAAQLFGIHIATLYRWIADRPDFPRPRKCGPRTTVFVTAELLAFRDKQIGGAK